MNARSRKSPTHDERPAPDQGRQVRRAALQLIGEVLDRQRPLDDAFDTSPAIAGLEARDRGFVRMSVATVLRRLGTLDALIRACLSRPLPARARPVRHVLRLGLAQILFMDVPAHAAVDTAVGLVRGRFPGQAPLVNAVLRRLSREGPAMLATLDTPRLDTPRWLWTAWTAAYGEDRARDIAAAHAAEPPLDITVRDTPETWAARLNAEILPTGSLRRRGGGSVTGLPGFAEGAWWVQDAAAALPARLLGAVEGLRVIDLCAAPGGKTAQLAAAGARVTAVDREPRRLARLQENLKRLGLEAETVAADGTEWRPATPADAVLLDAPCTATGTARRHPDILRLKKARDVATMTALQDRLLDAAVDMLKPGGLLLFSTCSLQPEERQARIDALRDRGAPVAADPIRDDCVPGLDGLVRDGMLQTLPCDWAEHGGMDGFFAARLRRV